MATRKSPPPPPEPRLAPEDLAFLLSVKRGNEWLRAVLCTLARRGVAFRIAHADRARGLLDALSTSPIYKGGQFLFDLLEWEDFMLDGPPPPLVPTALDGASLHRIAAFLERIKTMLDGGAVPTLEAFQLEGGILASHDLPPLKAGFYLYQDAVLGVATSAAPVLVAVQQELAARGLKP